MPKVVDATRQRRDIRRAARSVFARRGVGAGLAQVAEAAGMGRSSLYHYYPDRASLVRDIVRDLLAEEQRLFDRVADAPGSPLARLDLLAAALPALLDEWAAVGRLLLELRSRDARLFRPFFRRIRAALAGVIEAGQREGEIDPELQPELAAATVIGAIDGLLLQYLIDRSAFPDTAALGADLSRSLRKLLLP
jgi:AcrR family transcriptional regulator